MPYSIGINVIAQSCVKDLNLLKQTIFPGSSDMSWSHFTTLMNYGCKIITCFDDETHRVIGMTTLIPIATKTERIAKLCDTAIAEEYPDKLIDFLLTAAKQEATKSGFTLL